MNLSFSNFYQFPLGEVDLILRVVWLESLGDIQANWKKMYLKFYPVEKTTDGAAEIVGQE